VDFQQKTGIKATYAEDIDDNDAYYGKIQGQLKNGQDIGKDIIVLTDWMAARVIRQGYVQKLDEANIPNAKNLNPSLQNVDFDKGRTHSLTWQSGYGGIGYRKDKVGRELKTIADLWAPDLKGKIVVLSEMRDTVGLIMMEQGVDISSKFTEDDFNKGLEELQKQVDSGQIRQVKGNSYLEDLRSGNAIAAIGWSGDILLARLEEEDDNYTFTIPESGGTLWSDNLMVPIASPHKKNAETLMNYYYDPAVAAKVAAIVNYICPVEGAKAAMEKIDPSLVDSPLIFPTEEDLSHVKGFRTLSPDEEATYSEAFQKVIGN
jgi:spermidine/putrescine transport system substrate-binding protein